MKFQLRPILSEIKDLYSKPISGDRFKEYISKLQGASKGDMALPISGFNPMAKNHILLKIDELEKLEAEEIMQKTINEFNSTLNTLTNEDYLVVLNIADDLKGDWTNHYSTDFDSKFKLNPFVRRKFCVPYFWTSEDYNKDLIKYRTIEYLNRTIYWLINSEPKTLKEHLDQEIYVASKTRQNFSEIKNVNFEKIKEFYSANKESEQYDKIFNFFYGNEGSASLGYQQYGITKLLGYQYAKIIADKTKTTGLQ